MGTESVFAALLVKKTLQKLAKASYYLNWKSHSQVPLSQTGKDLLQSLHRELRHLQNQLELETEELLTTLLMGVIDLPQKEAYLICIGDGLIVADGGTVEFDQGDKPDYLAYHLHEDFDTWFASITQTQHFKRVSDLSISSDGILAFRNLKYPSQQCAIDQLIHYLMVDRAELEFSNGLDRKIANLAAEWHHFPTDDLAMIRVLL